MFCIGQPGFLQAHSTHMEDREKRARMDSAGSEPDQQSNAAKDNAEASAAPFHQTRVPAPAYHTTAGVPHPGSPEPMALELTAHQHPNRGAASSTNGGSTSSAAAFSNYLTAVDAAAHFHHSVPSSRPEHNTVSNDFSATALPFIKSSPSPEPKQTYASRQPASSPPPLQSGPSGGSLLSHQHFGAAAAPTASSDQPRDEKPCCSSDLSVGALSRPGEHTQAGGLSNPRNNMASGGVPIFALNAKGSFYVPMSLDLSVISPYLSLLSEESCAVLHPVTISVNFQVQQ